MRNATSVSDKKRLLPERRVQEASGGVSAWSQSGGAGKRSADDQKLASNCTPTTRLELRSSVYQYPSGWKATVGKYERG